MRVVVLHWTMGAFVVNDMQALQGKKERRESIPVRMMNGNCDIKLIICATHGSNIFFSRVLKKANIILKRISFQCRKTVKTFRT